MNSKLYKELGMSIGWGFSLAYSLKYYYYMKYLDVVNECYSAVKDKFATIPGLAAKLDEENNMQSMVKNFGMSAWNEGEVDDENDIDAMSE
eukprot:CAMPEP_0170482850 /NCGR_PEP_ID=MMETSP0208-20121228/2685_1 /TAXON_ID=197538 /ORGANISM="Strombidium inclinatum, Strain S3" /LENGTH=90 /DNA_ID=CAMNT_0010755727 /DNA_START=345 /DNA_END=617 /DNA_ORIENTATION=+